MSAQQVTVEIPEAAIKQTVTTDAVGRAEFRFPAKLELWSPGHPRLYDVVLSSGSDKVHDMIGFRTSKPAVPKYCSTASPFSCAASRCTKRPRTAAGARSVKEKPKTLLGWAREMGCNFVRLTHYPHSENMTRFADRMGLMVWSEIPGLLGSNTTNELSK